MKSSHFLQNTTFRIVRVLSCKTKLIFNTLKRLFWFSISNQLIILRKLSYILTPSEKKKFVVLSISTVFLSLSEAFSIGILIPIMGLFINQDKILTSKIFQWFYQCTGICDIALFFIILIVIAIMLFILKTIYSVFILYKQQNTIGSIRNRIKSEVLLSYLQKPYAFHLKNNSSILFKNVVTEVAQFSVGFLGSSIVFISEIIIVFGIFLLLIFKYPLITFIIVGILGSVMTFLNYFLKKRIKLYSYQREKYSEQKYKTALEALGAIKEIQVYNAQAFFLQLFSKSIKKYTESFIKFSIASNLPRSILEVIIFTFMLMVLLISIFYHKTPSELIPMMTVFAMSSLRVLPSINKIYINFNNLLYYQNSLDIVYSIVNEGSSTTMPEASLKLNPAVEKKEESIRLEHITFCHDSQTAPIFENLDLFIPTRKTVAIVGESGAGKSTLIDILMGLLIPSKGELYYGQTVINQDNIFAYRRKIGYVPQQIFLTDDSVEANIAFGIHPNRINSKQIEKVIKISQLESFVNNLPEGIKTTIGERGVRLSGGQKQRIGIARALYYNPEILILDEATSALDENTEVQIDRAIKELKGNLTVIIVAHRLSTVESSDIIYVMERGKIVDQGTFTELIKFSNVFQRIAKQKISFQDSGREKIENDKIKGVK